MERMKQRRQYFIDPEFQSKFVLKFCLIVGLSFALVGGVALLAFSGMTIDNFLFLVFFPMLFIVGVFSSLAVGILTLLASHKIAGPLFRIRKEIELVQGGDLRRQFHIRSGDQLQDLAQSLNEMTQTLRRRHLEIGGQCRSVTNFLEEKNFSACPEDRKKLLQMLKELYEMLGYFKV